MASRYKFSEEQIKEIEQARKDNKDKRAEARLKALELRAKGASSNEVAAATGFHAGSGTRLVAKYRDHGIEAISGNHYGGNHRNMSIEEEASILAHFQERAEKGELVEISEIAKAYQQAIDHPMSTGQIYRVLQREEHPLNVPGRGWIWKNKQAQILLVRGRDTTQRAFLPHPGVSLCLWSGRADDR